MKFYPFSLLLYFLMLLIGSQLSAQISTIGETPVKWENNKPPVIPEIKEKYAKSDLLILDDKTAFHFYSKNNELLVRHLLIKINTAKGLAKIENFKVPESFDEAYDGHLFKQGRAARIKSPFIAEYYISKFAARKFSSTKWETVKFKLNYEKIRWVKNSGEFVNDELKNFQFQNLSVGDVVEIYYEANFNSSYGSNLFYFQSDYPKINCEYEFIYKVMRRFENYAFIFPMNIKDSSLTSTYEEFKDYFIFTDKIKLKNCDAVNYPSNSFESHTQPHVFADFKFYRVLNGSYPDGTMRVYDYELYRPKNFNWVIFSDTTNSYTKIYDKQSAAIRKFTGKLPPLSNDSSIVPFFKALCDTLNDFRFISANQLFYNESALYNIYSGDHLLKRRLVEHALWKLYQDILNDKNVFYFKANIQDKRYGQHTLAYRTHYAYEHELIAIPTKKSYIYFMPRYSGLKYHLNELPFYLEGSLAALEARNFQETTEKKEEQNFKFIKTHRGTFNENTRTENAGVKISIDSLTIRLTTKESLSGQFSTTLRHLYLDELIDSTISPVYFKKCLDKPGSSNQKTKLSSRTTEFPFRYTFNCSEKIDLKNPEQLDLKNWFSFTLSKSSLPELPNHDYYFDFDFSDLYNFSLEFGKPILIQNLSDFKRTISNAYFELESEIVKNSDSNYLVKVKLLVKTLKVPVQDVGMLMEIIEELDRINNFKLLFKS